MILHINTIHNNSIWSKLTATPKLLSSALLTKLDEWHKKKKSWSCLVPDGCDKVVVSLKFDEHDIIDEPPAWWYSDFKWNFGFIMDYSCIYVNLKYIGNVDLLVQCTVNWVENCWYENFLSLSSNKHNASWKKNPPSREQQYL